MGMRPDDYDRSLNKAADDRGDGGTGYFQTGEAEFSEDQNVIESEVDKYCHETRHHGHPRLPALAEGACVHFLDAEGDQPDQHDSEVVTAVLHYKLRGLRGIDIVKVQPHQRIALQEHDRHSGEYYRKPYIKLKTKRVSHSLVVAFSVKLCGKYSRPGQRSEQR